MRINAFAMFAITLSFAACQAATTRAPSSDTSTALNQAPTKTIVVYDGACNRIAEPVGAGAATLEFRFRNPAERKGLDRLTFLAMDADVAVTLATAANQPLCGGCLLDGDMTCQESGFTIQSGDKLNLVWTIGPGSPTFGELELLVD